MAFVQVVLDVIPCLIELLFLILAKAAHLFLLFPVSLFGLQICLFVLVFVGVDNSTSLVQETYTIGCVFKRCFLKAIISTSTTLKNSFKCIDKRRYYLRRL